MTQHPTREDITAAVHTIQRLCQRLHITGKLDAPKLAFLMGAAEVILLARALGALQPDAATAGTQRAVRTALGRDCLAAVDDHPFATQAGYLAGAAAANTIRRDKDCWLLRMAQGLSQATGIPLPETIAMLSVGGSQ